MCLICLSKDCLFKVLSYVFFCDLLHLGQTSKYFRSLVRCPIVWKQFFQSKNLTLPSSIDYEYDTCIQYWKKWTLSRVMEETLMKGGHAYLNYIFPETGRKWIGNGHWGEFSDIIKVDARIRQLTVCPAYIIDTEIAPMIFSKYELWLRDNITNMIPKRHDVFDPPPFPLDKFEVTIYFGKPLCNSYSHYHFNLIPINLDTFWNILNTSNTILEIMNNLEKKILGSDPLHGVACDDIEHQIEGDINETHYVFPKRKECNQVDFRKEWEDLKSHICILFKTILND